MRKVFYIDKPSWRKHAAFHNSLQNQQKAELNYKSPHRRAADVQEVLGYPEHLPVCRESLLARQNPEADVLAAGINALQGEGTVQVVVGRHPDVVERDLLENENGSNIV